MGSILKRTSNTRYLPNSMKYIRSDVPNLLTEEDINWLLDNNVRTIIDLRTLEEQERKPCPLAKISGFKYCNAPVAGGNEVPATQDQVALSYINMVDDSMLKTIELIENAKTNVLFFCNAGKDRTGVVAALLLLRQHVDESSIVHDYVLSADNLREHLEAYAIQNPEVDIKVITPRASYMEDFIRGIKKDQLG